MKYGNDIEVRVLIHTPKTLKDQKNRFAFIDVHGGGAIGGSPEINTPTACYEAIQLNAVVFNPQYRLADQGAKIDQVACEIVAVIKWMHENAATLGIDPKRICLYACSGGGFISSAAVSKLALNNESHLLKLLILNQFMTPVYWLVTKKEDMPLREIRDGFYDAPFVARAYATDIDK